MTLSSLVLMRARRSGKAPRTWVGTFAITFMLFTATGALATPLFDGAPFLFYRTPLGPSGAVVADFNSDSRSDVAVACRGVSPAFEGLVSVFLGRADGTLLLAQDVPVGAGASFIAAADVDHDGSTDLVTANTEANSISVLRGDGHGDFAVATELSAMRPICLAVGVINGDGHLDIVAATASGILVYLGDGNGGFKPHLASPALADFVAIGRINGDTFDDLALSGQTITILIGDGNGDFTPSDTLTRFCSPYAVALADINSDSKTDLATTVVGNSCEAGPTLVSESVQLTPRSGATVFYGNGDGSFVWARGQGLSANGGYLTCVTSADFNHDGSVDLAGSVDSFDYGHGVEVSLGAQGGELQRVGLFSTGTSASFVASGDIDGDGDVDLVTVVPAGIAVLHGNGDGTFEKGRTTGARYEPTHFAVGRLNDDEFPDLAVALETVEIFFGARDGNLVSGGAIDFGYGHGYDLVALADLNLDGAADVVAALRSSPWNTGRVAIVHGDGHGNLGAPMFFESTGDSVPVGDQNGDGWIDMVVDGTAVAYGTGPNTFGPPQEFPGRGARTAIADFDRDGQNDLARRNDGCSIAFTGTTKTDTTTAFGVGQAIIELVAADFDADGLPDIATLSFGPREYSRGIITVLLNTLPDSPTAALVSLSRATVEDGRIRLEWYAPRVSACRLYRSTGGEWDFVATLTADQAGRIVFEDQEVTPGRRHGYRLGIVNGSEETFHGESWIDVPALRLSLIGAVPNPVTLSALVVRFTLPSAQPATLELYDLAGRRLIAKQVGALGPGSHAIDLREGSKLRSGVYALRLSQAGQACSRKFVVLP